ncbi:MAG: hypothetical protein EOP04_24225 [Proteobacteria bacterium]|nr:MAG: hypothetical protein EOP04_24225 [Pseudomonadota bacterium]
MKIAPLSIVYQMLAHQTFDEDVLITSQKTAYVTAVEYAKEHKAQNWKLVKGPIRCKQDENGTWIEADDDDNAIRGLAYVFEFADVEEVE